MAVWYGTDRNTACVIINVTKSLRLTVHRPDLPSCSGTARWSCWSGGPSRGGWPPGCGGRTRSPAGRTEAGAGSWPSGWWASPHLLGSESPQSAPAGDSPGEKQTRRARSTRQCRQTGKRKKKNGAFFFCLLFRSLVKREAGTEEVWVQARANYPKKVKVTPMTLESCECSTTHYHGWNCEAAHLAKRMTKKEHHASRCSTRQHIQGEFCNICTKRNSITRWIASVAGLSSFHQSWSKPYLNPEAGLYSKYWSN